MSAPPGPGALAAMGERLRRSGLRPRLVTAALGGATAVHAAHLAAARPPPPPATAAAALIQLWVAGVAVPRRLAEAAHGPDLEALAALGLLELGDPVRPLVALLPLGEALLACRREALPDDSSFHLAGALPPGPLGRWLDVGTGCGFAPLARPRLAAEILGTDVDGDAVELARVGAALSGRRRELTLAAADLFGAAAGRYDLITFNAPIADAPPLVARFWERAAAHLAPGGEVLVHSLIAPPELPGELVVARYTPADHRPSFAVARWRPDGRPGRRVLAAELSAASPHLRRAQMDSPTPLG